MSTHRRLNLPLPWLLVGAGTIVTLILLANQTDLVNNLKTATVGSSKTCALDYDKPAMKEKIACIVKSSSNKLDAYIVSTTLKVTQTGTGKSQTWEAKATCRLMCDCNNVSAQPESGAANACTNNFRSVDVDSNLVCNVPSSYKVPFGYATTVSVQDKDKFEAIHRINERCDAYEGARTNTCSSQCISEMPAAIKDAKAEVTCRQCKQAKKIPSAPKNLEGKAGSSTTITWSWTDTSNNETGFRLKDKNGNIIAPIPQANLQRYTEKNLKPNTSYSRQISSYNKDGESALSNLVTVKTPTASKSTSSKDVDYCVNVLKGEVMYNRSTDVWCRDRTTGVRLMTIKPNK